MSDSSLLSLYGKYLRRFGGWFVFNIAMQLCLWTPLAERTRINVVHLRGSLACVEILPCGAHSLTSLVRVSMCNYSSSPHSKLLLSLAGNRSCELELGKLTCYQTSYRPQNSQALLLFLIVTGVPPCLIIHSIRGWSYINSEINGKLCFQDLMKYLGDAKTLHNEHRSWHQWRRAV